MTEKIILDISSIPQQLDLYNSVLVDRIPNTAYVGGLGSGKTVAGVATALTILQEHPGIRGLLTAPSFDQLQEGSIQTFEEWAYPYIKDHNRSTHKITMIWNDGHFFSELLYRSTSDPSRIRAHEYGFAWMDEGARSSRDSATTIRGRLRSTRGAVGKDWHYPLFLTSTPVGRNWVYQRFGPGNRDLKASERKRYKLIHARTADNIHLPTDYLIEQELAYRGQEQLRLQELEGLFVSFEGLVFPQFDEDKHVTPDPVQWDASVPLRRVAGVDFGGGHPTAIVVLAQGQSGRIHQFKEKIWNRNVGADEIGEYLMNIHALTPFEGVWCDPTGQTAIATLRNGGLPAGPLVSHSSTVRVINDREEGIRLMGMLLSRDQLTISPSCAHSISEFYDYLYKETSDAIGNTVLTKTPSEHHADAMDARRYALMGLMTRAGPLSHAHRRNRKRKAQAAA